MAFQRKSLPIGDLKSQFGGGAPIGSIVFFSGNLVNGNPWVTDDWLVCNGAELNRSTYSELFSVIGAKYGSSSNTTFNIPSLLSGEFLRCAGPEHTGIKLSDGLPWIKGGFRTEAQISGVTGGEWYYGAFRPLSINTMQHLRAATDPGGWTAYNFDASWSNEVYSYYETPERYTGKINVYGHVIPYCMQVMPMIRVK